MSFKIPSKDINTNFIKKVYASSRVNDNRLVINMSVNEKLSNIIVWNLRQDIEMDSYDVSNEAQVIFDENGRVYILD